MYNIELRERSLSLVLVLFFVFFTRAGYPIHFLERMACGFILHAPAGIGVGISLKMFKGFSFCILYCTSSSSYWWYLCSSTIIQVFSTFQKISALKHANSSLREFNFVLVLYMCNCCVLFCLFYSAGQTGKILLVNSKVKALGRQLEIVHSTLEKPCL